MPLQNGSRQRNTHDTQAAAPPTLAFGLDRKSNGAAIILPGLGCPAEYFAPLGDKLSEKLDVAVFAITFEGFDSNEYGAYDTIPMSTHGAQAIAAFDNITTDHGISPDKVSIVGHCYGSTMALHLAGERQFQALMLLAPLTVPDFAWTLPMAEFPDEKQPGPFFEWKSREHLPANNRLLCNLAQFPGHVRIVAPHLDKHIKLGMLNDFTKAPSSAASFDSELLRDATHRRPVHPDDRITRWWDNSVVDAIDRHLGPVINEPTQSLQPVAARTPRTRAPRYYSQTGQDLVY